MRFAKILSGLLLLVVAAWFVIPAALEAWSLVSLPIDSPKQPGMEFAIGRFSFRSWSFVLTTGFVGVMLTYFGFRLLLLRNAES
jgi:hypothetical protein